MRISDWISDVCSSDLLIARALLSRPSVLLLDEPTRSLDPLGARRFREFLREEIVAGQGCTVLSANHKAEEALALRSEERRAGTKCVSTCRSRWSQYYKKNNRGRKQHSMRQTSW